MYASDATPEATPEVTPHISYEWEAYIAAENDSLNGVGMPIHSIAEYLRQCMEEIFLDDSSESVLLPGPMVRVFEYHSRPTLNFGPTHQDATIMKADGVRPNDIKFFKQFKVKKSILIISPWYDVADSTWSDYIDKFFATEEFAFSTNSSFSSSDSNPTSKFYCDVNDTTHFRVSISPRMIPRTSAGIDAFKTLVRKLALIVLAFEDEIDKLHADFMGYVTYNFYALSPTMGPVLNPLDRFERLRLVRDAATLPDIIDIVNPEFGQHNRNYFKVNFVHTALVEIGNGVKPYVQFRQHASSLNGTELKHWISFVYALYNLASRMPMEDCEHLVGIGEPMAAYVENGMDLMDLFSAMALWGSVNDEKMVDFYARRLLARPGGMRIRSRGRRLMPTEDGEEADWLDADEEQSST